MSRLLFLDFDGVLHPLAPVSELHPDKWFCWLPVLTELLAPWSDIEIVVHSSWRAHFTAAELRQLLGTLGPRVIGGAPSIPKPQAIEAVLNANAGLVHSHVVLDDDPRLARYPGLQVILCDPQMGLSSSGTQAELLKWLTFSRPG